ncbi:MAG: deoxyribonuclease IV [Micromonosporaceae bacterium]|nr:deoxyribonuclease IV [Micromonosporaceae bacterium]
MTDRPVGAHAPTAGGLAKAALPYVDATGAEVVQVFVSNPRGWARSAGDPAQDAQFVAGCAERGVAAYVHATLLVNLGSPTPATVAQSGAALAHALDRGAVIGARGVVFHAGSAVTPGPAATTEMPTASLASLDRSDARGYAPPRPLAAGDEGAAERALRQVREVLLPLLDRTAGGDGPRLLVEPSAGGGRSLVARVEQLGPFLAAVDRHPGLGVCFDTCHAWAAGHDLASPGGMAATLDALVAAAGPDRLWLVHANDSRDGCGSTRDRHQTVGEGSIGEPGFAELMTHPATAGVPVIVETPSVGAAGHAADIATLRRLRDAGRSAVR